MKTPKYQQRIKPRPNPGNSTVRPHARPVAAARPVRGNLPATGAQSGQAAAPVSGGYFDGYELTLSSAAQNLL